MKNISFLSENFQFLEVKFSIYLNMHFFCNEKCLCEVFLMSTTVYLFMKK